MRLNNGQMYTEELAASETYPVPFEKDQIDFFTVPVNENAKSEVRISFAFASGPVVLSAGRRSENAIR